MPRRQQPGDRRDALDDEQLLALDAPPGRRVGQLHVVGEPRIASLDGHEHGDSLAALTRHRRSRDHRTHVRPHLHLQGSLFGFDEPAVDGTFGGVRRTHLDDHSWIDHAPGWLHGDAGRVRPALARADLAPANGDDVGTPSPRAAADVVVDAGGRGRAAARARRDAPRASAPTTASRSTRSASTATETATTRSPGTAIVTATRSTTRSSPSSASVPPARSACGHAGRRRGDVVRPRPRRPVGDGRRLPARLGALRAQGGSRRTAHLDHLSARSTLTSGTWTSDGSPATARMPRPGRGWRPSPASAGAGRRRCRRATRRRQQQPGTGDREAAQHPHRLPRKSGGPLTTSSTRSRWSSAASSGSYDVSRCRSSSSTSTLPSQRLERGGEIVGSDVTADRRVVPGRQRRAPRQRHVEHRPARP